jgi:putative membrane protein
MTASELGEILPHVNAALNATSAACLVLGFRAIKRKQIETHERYMLGAVVASALFFVAYGTRIALTGSHSFPQVGLLRSVYLVILVSHSILAVINVPLVIRTLYLAKRGRFDNHRKIAKFTLPIWAYVCVTGVIVYVLLYHVAPRLT